MRLFSNLTGEWKGSFSYGPEYSELQGKCVDFKLVLEDDNGSLTGTSIDSETKDVFTDQIIVQGFWDSETISFTIQYPCPYYVGENDKIIIDKTGEPHSVTYTGFYDKIADCFLGEWEIIVDSQKIGDGWVDNSLTGMWRMERA